MPDREWAVIERDLKRKFAAIKDEVWGSFLRVEAPILESKIAETFYTAGGQGVKTRSGTARRGWDTIFPSPVKAIIVNTVPYADFTKEKTITPKNAKALAIPIGKALTPAGVPRFSGPHDPSLPPLTLIKLPGKAPILAAKVGKGKIQPYFVLVKRVKIPAYTAGLPAFVKEEGAAIHARFLPILRGALA